MLNELYPVAYTMDIKTYESNMDFLSGEGAIAKYEALSKNGAVKRIPFNQEHILLANEKNAEDILFKYISKEEKKMRATCPTYLVCWYWGTCYAGNGSCPPNCSPITPKKYYRPKYYKWYNCQSTWITTTFATNCGSCPN